jgi:hypothetical protein
MGVRGRMKKSRSGLPNDSDLPNDAGDNDVPQPLPLVDRISGLHRP